MYHMYRHDVVTYGSENQSSRDTGGPGIEAGFPLVFHWANISTPILA